MDVKLYRQFLEEYIAEATRNSDGTVRGISERLHEFQITSKLSRNKVERERALHDARQAFDEHRHWPLEIILLHLGIKP